MEWGPNLREYSCTGAGVEVTRVYDTRPWSMFQEDPKSPYEGRSRTSDPWSLDRTGFDNGTVSIRRFPWGKP